jgi:beta-glucosidase/6-phospho-beta-glucosidase/beta-galactosidase
MWCTINEPNVYSLLGYATGEFPPGKTDPRIAGIVMRNLAEAHVRVYHTLKKLPGGNETKIGIVINWNQFDPLNFHSALDRFSAAILQDVYTTNWLSFFTKG